MTEPLIITPELFAFPDSSDAQSSDSCELWDGLANELNEHIARADLRYGNFASAHEALGVAMEEWDELRDAIRWNNLAAVEDECIDLAAVLMRLARQLRNDRDIRLRSVK